MAILCFIVFMNSIKGLTKISSIMVPILILSIIILSILNMINIDFSKIGLNVSNISGNFDWFIKSVIYCSYNIILLIPVLVSLKDFIKSKKQIIGISVLTSIITFCLAMSIFLFLVNVDKDFSLLEMPAVYVIGKDFPTLSNVYGLVILISIFSTAISIGISFLENISKNKKSYTQFAIIMCITSIIISNFGFSNLVNYLYPIFGFLGLIQMIYILM